MAPRRRGLERALVAAVLALGLWLAAAPKASARNEWVTVPIILTDYYGWSYAEIFQDRADAFGWSVAGVDSLGWGILATTRDYAGLFFVNLAGMAKTVYPVVTLLGAQDGQVKDRAWIALGTHTATLLSLELLGHPALSLQAMGPHRDGMGLALACRF